MRVHQLTDTGERHRALLRKQAEDAIGFIRPREAVGVEIAIPVGDVCDTLRVRQPRRALAQVSEHEQRGQPLDQPPGEHRGITVLGNPRKNHRRAHERKHYHRRMIENPARGVLYAIVDA
jgi:hypothetical protein